MAAPLVLVTGFGPFPGTPVNPSREVARLLEAAPPAGLRVQGSELPVSFRDTPAVLRAVIAGLEAPAALLGLGVQKEPGFRLERRARGRYETERVDNDGLSAAGLRLDVGEDLVSDLDLEALAGSLRAAGASEVCLSDDAGGYLCELTNHTLLDEGRRLGIPALFLHVPPAAVLAPERQAPLVGALARALALGPEQARVITG